MSDPHVPLATTQADVGRPGNSCRRISFRAKPHSSPAPPPALDEPLPCSSPAKAPAVVLTDINESAGHAVAAEITEQGGRAIFEPGDVTSAADCQRVTERAVREFGGIHILFNNAGIIRRASVVELSESDWDRVMAVNVKAIFLMSRQVIPVMARRAEGPSSIPLPAGVLPADRGRPCTALPRARWSC